MRRVPSALAVAAALVIAGSAVATAGGDDGDVLPSTLRRGGELQQRYDRGVKSGSALNMVAVGQADLGGRGFNGDVWVHEGYAYVGRWGFFDSSHPQYCPVGGVAVVDVRDPARPTEVADLEVPGASHEDVVVYTARHGPLTGRDVAAVGLQYCASSRLDPAAAGRRGVALWDVTDPASPTLLSVLDTGCCTRGVHELEVGDRDDLGRTFVYASVPFAERLEGDGATLRDRAGRGEAWIVDVTDPAQPAVTSTFGIRKDLGMDPAAGQGCFAVSFGHGVDPSEDGTSLFLSYWDAGYLSLDITDPAQPRFLGRAAYLPGEDGDGHSTSYDDRRRLLFAADEDFCPTSGPAIERGWGYLRVFGVTESGALTRVGTFKTANSVAMADPAGGDYSVHNPLVVGTDVYLSWYSDGVRVVDTSDPANPREVAYFVPPAGQQPVKPSGRDVLTNTPQVWGVAVDEATGLIYASDMNTGLWILRRTDRG